MKYYNIELRENPYRYFNANGTFRKVQKGRLIDPRVYVAIADRGMIWRMSTPTREDRQKADASVYTWLGRGILSPRLSISLFLDIS